MKMIRFAVWGIGVRGKNVIRDLGDKVVCIIEGNEEYYCTNYENIPIVSCDEYIKCYSEYPVIITPFGYENNIKQLLLEKGIWNVFIYYDCQDIIKAFSLKTPIDDFIRNFDKNHKVMIYTGEMLGCLLYNYLLEKGLLQNAQVVSDTLFQNNYVKNIKELYGEYYKEIMLNLSDFYFNPKLLRFKNIHQGRRGFIVATGASLRMEDLDKLYTHNEICISMNGIFAAFDSTRWRPSYYMAADLKAVQQWKKEILDEQIEAKFIAVWAAPELMLDDREKREDIYEWYAFKERMGEEKLYFSKDFARGTSTGWTVTYSAIQLAAYMGFSEIYLLGTDCNYKKGSQNNHFLKEKEKDMMDHNELGMILSYQVAKEYADVHDIKIYNATRGGMLEVFERVDFDRLFEN